MPAGIDIWPPLERESSEERLTAARTYQWIHSLSRLVNALIGAGLTLEFLHEHPTLPWPLFPMFVRGLDGMYRLPDSVPSFPLSVSLRARKV